MKRLLIFTLALLLCFAVACEKEEKPIETPIDTPEVTEPVEKPEVIEPVEIPTEVQENEEKIIQLLKEDENTKKYVIDFPSEFYYEHDSSYKIVDFEEFEWGEYLPFVRYPLGFYYESGTPVYAYSILSENTPTLNDGRALYDKLNKKYLTTYPIDRSIRFDGYNLFELEWSDEYEKYFFNSRIIYLSKDASKIGIFHLFDHTEQTKEPIEFWKGKFELFENRKCTFKKFIDNVRHTEGSGIINDRNLSPEKYYQYKLPLDSSISFYRSFDFFNNTDLVGYIADYSDPSDITHCFFSSETGNFLFTIEAKNSSNLDAIWSIEQIINNRYAVIRFSTDGIKIRDGSYVYDSYTNVYLYDLETGDKTHIANYAFYPRVSPDLKYLVFTSPQWEDLATTDYNEFYYIKDGFYVCNIETKEMLFYTDEKVRYFFDTISWINKKKFLELIN